MRAKHTKALILLVFVISCLPYQSASADMGPKPTMDFTFTQAFPGTPVSIASGTMFECAQADCSDAKPLMEAGPQRFSCEAASCHALAYGFSDYHRLEIEFSDGKTRQSNIFKTSEFNATYKVTIREADLLVEPNITLGTLSPYIFILVCCCCLLGVVVVIMIVLMIARRRSKMQ
jgi:hypothetical protein